MVYDSNLTQSIRLAFIEICTHTSVYIHWLLTTDAFTSDQNDARNRTRGKGLIGFCQVSLHFLQFISIGMLDGSVSEALNDKQILDF